ncbi:uncharacterized protein PODANS_6_60 [Podospora anserina S mat+]|uniref:Podospora anserina S mat+ genomic DNA chromosome 6, supercontig 2 n=1 Tax=Podospora anserina (strain S / ATCC MYA-4624 / DSM 980 / FGSC 10383) TaxID=515849 RepID=B2B3G7_PODAN|nr:uncharacterized protein PODANS_6_60 [Podospora anserina S mat+]CAP71653.1 unnamed protein product [Podospora anserina S mat+]CDP31046.1 Putative protein of unknown function [Podospora anserina S mat+]
MASTNQQDGFLRFERWIRQQGDDRPSRIQSDVTELTRWGGYDFDMIFAPLDGRYRGPPSGEYDQLIQLYDIPDDFVAERERSVTHSFGHQLGENGVETLWMHFLVKIPTTASQPNQHEPWLKWGFVMTWKPKPMTPTERDTVEPENSEYCVTFLAFQPPLESIQALVTFILSSTWNHVNNDPYVIVDVALSSWYQRVDSIAWDVTHLVRTDEKRLFERAKILETTDPSSHSRHLSSLDLHGIHTSAKNAIYLTEALDAILRAVDRVLSAHKELLHDPKNKWRTEDRTWENTHRLLRYRSELFNSTRLRIVSSHERIKNAVDLAFHLNNAQDSRIGMMNSRSVRIISIVGLIFIPFSAASSIFGTQFFSFPDNNEHHMQVNQDIWYLFATAIPVTIGILLLWKASENDQLRLPGGLASLFGCSSQPRPRDSPSGERGILLNDMEQQRA